MTLETRKTSDLIPYARNPRKNDQAVDAVAASIKEFGFKVPIIIDKEGVIVAGHTRLKAAQKLGLESVPVIVADDLTPEQAKAFRLLENRVAEKADWDIQLLAMELDELALSLDPFDANFEALLPLFEVEAPAESKDKKGKQAVCPQCGCEFKP